MQSDPHYHGSDIASLSANELINLHNAEHAMHEKATGNYMGDYRPGGKPFYGRIELAATKPKQPGNTNWL